VLSHLFWDDKLFICASYYKCFINKNNDNVMAYLVSRRVGGKWVFGGQHGATNENAN